MKHLIYYELNPELTRFILNKTKARPPSFGLHSTLYYLKSNQTDSIINSLEKISFQPLEIETTKFETFKNNLLVLKLKKSEEIINFHNKIHETIKDLNQFYKQTFLGKDYNPHITLQKITKLKILPKELIGLTEIISEYHLAKKIKEKWTKIETFTP
jgi:2'-5' RNA ligase